MSSKRSKYLQTPIEHIDITKIDTRQTIDSFSKIRGSAGDLAQATNIFNRMLSDPKCTNVLALAGSPSAQGLMNIWPTLVKNKMIDVVVSTGASVIDMDLLEALGFRHYQGNPNVDNEEMGNEKVDRIYDTNIDELELQQIDAFCHKVMNTLAPRPYAPWEILWHMGKYLSEHPEISKKKNSLVQTCFENGVPIFSPSFVDSAFGMGGCYHQVQRSIEGKQWATLDTIKDYLDMSKIKMKTPTTGLLMIGGGVPKNAIQDTVIVAQGLLATLRDLGKSGLVEKIGYKKDEQDDEVPLHKYAIQITVADPRDGACSSSTLEEARTWGKVDLTNQKMVFGEATSAVPLLASDAYHRGLWKQREPRKLADWLNSLQGPADFVGQNVQNKAKTKVAISKAA